jgi:hypothetical protein
MKTRVPVHRHAKRPTGGDQGSVYDLKFVPIGIGKHAAGGWYRELPDDQIEVMSRGQLERVSLDHKDPEEKAKSVVRGILRRK